MIGTFSNSVNAGLLDCTNPWHSRFPMNWCVRFALLFSLFITFLSLNMSFTVALTHVSQIANKELWHHSDIDDWPMSNFFGTFISISTVLVLWLINIWLLPKGIMSTAVKYAMPPYVDQVTYISQSRFHSTTSFPSTPSSHLASITLTLLSLSHTHIEFLWAQFNVL